MKKKILLIASMALVATLSVKSTVAYLYSQTETIVNETEMGNVSIKQLEYERVVDENGNWVFTTDREFRVMQTCSVQQVTAFQHFAIILR